MKFTNLNKVRKFRFGRLELWNCYFSNSGFPPLRNKMKRQMAVCRSPSPLSPVDVKPRVSRQQNPWDLWFPERWWFNDALFRETKSLEEGWEEKLIKNS